MFRSDWRRFKKSSGGAMLEKCCHDLDLCNWLANGIPQNISSFAGVKSLKPNPELPERCEDCKITDTCSYYLPPKAYDHPDMVHKANDGLLYKFTRDNSQCIYNNGHDNYDHQTVNIEYDNGVLVNFTMDFSAGGKECGRHLKIIGTKGVIKGKCEDNKIELQDKLTDKVEAFEIQDDGSGHGGSNRKHADVFIEMMRDENVFPTATVEAGYVSAMMCFAADKAAETKQVQDVSNIMSDAGLEAGFDI
jgi:predicted dehydrogenase